MENDIEHITNKIVTFVSTIFNNNKNKFIKPTYAMQHILYKLVMRKQFHTCGIDVSTNLIVNMNFHLLCNQTNNPNSITTQIDENIIAQGMKTKS